MLARGEYDTRRVKKHDVLVELDLLHLFSDAWHVTGRGGFATLERVDERGLADIRETDDAHSDEGLGLGVALDSGIVLQDVKQVFCPNSGREMRHFIDHFGILDHGLLMQSGTSGQVLILSLCPSLE